MIVHGLRWPRHIHAYSTSGFDGFTSRSAAPIESDTYSTLRQFLPPSVLLNTPRSSLFLNALPIAATHTVFGLVGCTRTAPICPDSYRPANDQLLPPSVDL